MKLTNSIHKSEGLLKRKRRNLSVEDVNDREFDIDMKNRRLISMQHRATHVKKQLAEKHFSEWKRSLKMQTGKKLGKYTIKRGAEMAIYAALAEQLKAHRRCWGDEGTG